MRKGFGLWQQTAGNYLASTDIFALLEKHFLKALLRAPKEQRFSDVFIYLFYFYFLSFCLLSFVVVVVAISWAAPAACGGSQARG